MLMKVLLIVVATIVVLAASVILIGWMLPERHELSRSADLRQPPDVVWRAITDVSAFPSWRTDVTSVESLAGAHGHESWRETGKNGRITYEVVESYPPRRMVTKIADRSLPFGGSWTYELAPIDGGTRLSITERGEVYNPVYRFMSRYVIGHAGTVEGYLRNLRRKLAG
jgi:uncharacterized protein YndB with AHSA1/START domain